MRQVLPAEGSAGFFVKNSPDWDFPGSPLVESLLSNAGDSGSIPGRETGIPHATEQLSL